MILRTNEARDRFFRCRRIASAIQYLSSPYDTISASPSFLYDEHEAKERNPPATRKRGMSGNLGVTYVYRVGRACRVNALRCSQVTVPKDAL